MAPEAISKPEAIDARADVYAVGAVGYFLTTGRHVFEARTLVETLADHLHTAPIAPSVRLGAPVPADFEAVLLACLAKRPEDRPASAETMGERLRACAAAGVWSTADGRAWWARSGPRVRELRAGRAVSREHSGFVTRATTAAVAR
jgi:serine/threonine-protein kinase